MSSVGGHKTEPGLIFSQLRTMQTRGLPPGKALRALGEHAQDRKLGRTLADMASSVESGATLSHAMSNHPSLFSPQDLELVSLGENSSSLGTSLGLLVRSFEFRARQKATIRANLFYPLILVIIMLTATGLYGAVAYAAMFSVGWPPGPERTIWSELCPSLVLHALLFLFVAAIAFFPIHSARWLDRGGEKGDRRQLRIPFFGRNLFLHLAGEFKVCAGMFLEAGLDVGPAVRKSLGVLRNSRLHSDVAGALDEIERGADFIEALRGGNLFSGPELIRLQRAADSGAPGAELMRLGEESLTLLENRVRWFYVVTAPVLLIVVAVIMIVSPLHTSDILAMWGM